jgi:hypothetical protein
MPGNSNSGRRPKPTAIKIAEGNRGKRPLNDKEPIPPDGSAQMPPLSTPAQCIWQRLAPIAEHMGTLTTADAQSFGTMCELIALFEAKPDQKVAAVLKSYFADFGFTP